MSQAIVTVETTGTPKSGGHYAQAVACGELLFVSGQLPVSTQGHALANADFETQAEQTFTNLFNILAAAGAGPADVLKLSAYIVGVDNWPSFNQVCARRFGSVRPARVVVPVPELHYGYLVEVDAIARRPG